MARLCARFATILGLTSLAYGIGWLTIWNEGIQGDSSLDGLASEFRPPLDARLMVLVGLLLLLVASVTWMISRLATAKRPGKTSKT